MCGRASAHAYGSGRAEAVHEFIWYAQLPFTFCACYQRGWWGMIDTMHPDGFWEGTLGPL